MKQRVLILCTGNSARSQMAEGLLRHDAGDRFTVESAGSVPSAVRPEAIRVLQEIGIDIHGQRSKHVDTFAGQPFEYVLTVCDKANESCPIFPGAAKRLHHSFDDPPAPTEGLEEERLMVFRRVRDELRQYLREFAADAGKIKVTIGAQQSLILKPGITNYCNRRHLAEIMSIFGLVQRSGIGIALARREMERNGNPPITFQAVRGSVLVVLKLRVQRSRSVSVSTT